MWHRGFLPLHTPTLTIAYRYGATLGPRNASSHLFLIPLHFLRFLMFLLALMFLLVLLGIGLGWARGLASALSLSLCLSLSLSLKTCWASTPAFSHALALELLC